VRREVDIFGVVLIVYPWREHPNDMHLRHAAVVGEIADQCSISLLGRYLLHQLTNHVTQAMRLLLAGNVTRDAARILNILLPVQNLPDRARHRPDRIPQVYGEDQ
jgi:hypothetical protein